MQRLLYVGYCIFEDNAFLKYVHTYICKYIRIKFNVKKIVLISNILNGLICFYTIYGKLKIIKNDFLMTKVLNYLYKGFLKNFHFQLGFQ